MPIYAYRCSTCGHAKDVLQKISDPLLSVCPACGASTFTKQVTAAGFQLKGSGWYVTDFRGDNKGTSAAPVEPAANGAGDGAGEGTGAKADGDSAKAAADRPASGSGDKPVAAKSSADKPSAEKPAASKPASGSGGTPTSST